MKLKQSLLTAAVLYCVTAWDGTGAAASEPATGKRNASWVDKRVEDWQPTKAERAFDEIAWAKDLREAQRLAKEHGRPIFLFTYDGASLACYRC